jgi:hypothetical protein
MAKWSWRTTPDESVEVDHGDGDGLVRSTSLPHSNVLATQQRVFEWGPLAAKAGAKYGVPLSWILAFVFAESGGKADANNAPLCGGTGCVGLMAIHWAVHGQTLEDMLDPEKNLDYGTSLLAESRRRGYDLPAAASIHVAGGGTEYKPHSGTCCSALCKPSCGRNCSEHPEHPEGSPFGMCEHMFPRTDGDGSVGYIDRIVRANNSFIDLLAGRGYQDPTDDPFYKPGISPADAMTQTAPGSGGLGSVALFLGSGLASYLAAGGLTSRLRSGS